MKKIIVLGLAALAAVSCSKSNTATVNATITGADQKEIIVSKLAVNQLKTVDTVKTNGSGVVKAQIAAGETPDFYYLSYNGKKLAEEEKEEWYFSYSRPTLKSLITVR